MCVCVCTQSCPALCSPRDCSPPGSSVHGISQARTLEWAAISFSKGFFLTQGSHPYLLHLLHCLPLSYLGSQKIWYFLTFSWFSLGVYVNLNWYPVSQWGCHRISLDFTPCCAGSSICCQMGLIWLDPLPWSFHWGHKWGHRSESAPMGWHDWGGLSIVITVALGPRIWGVPVTL